MTEASALKDEGAGAAHEAHTCPGYELRALHAMSSASIMMMLLSGIPSRFTVLPLVHSGLSGEREVLMDRS